MVALLVARVGEAAFSQLFLSHCFEMDELTHVLVVSIVEAAARCAASLREEALLARYG